MMGACLIACQIILLFDERHYPGNTEEVWTENIIEDLLAVLVDAAMSFQVQVFKCRTRCWAEYVTIGCIGSPNNLRRHDHHIMPSTFQ